MGDLVSWFRLFRRPGVAQNRPASGMPVTLGKGSVELPTNPGQHNPFIPDDLQGHQPKPGPVPAAELVPPVETPSGVKLPTTRSILGWWGVAGDRTAAEVMTMEAFVAKAVAAEREACARIASTR